MKVHPASQLATGQLFAHYQLIQRLDRRRGIEIWQAQHIVLHVPVVLKVIIVDNREIGEYQRDIAFIRNEAQVLSSLHHQYIIGYRDYLEGRNFCALVLEYARYGSIAHRHGTGRKLPLFLVRLYVAQIGRALHALHQQNKIHRDVKPNNILLLDRHHAVLADFELTIDNPEDRYVRKPQVGGTLAYMAPEQFSGLPRAASDQYSLAVCAYEWLTGHQPFMGETEALQMRRALRIPRSVRLERPELPLAIDQVMWTALHPDPARRYASVLEFARAFSEITRRARPPLLKRWPYYRNLPWRGQQGESEQPSTRPRFYETGELPTYSLAERLSVQTV